MTEKDKLPDYEKVKHNEIPNLPSDGTSAGTLRVYNEMMRNVESSMTLPVGTDIASMITAPMLAPSASIVMQAVVQQHNDTASKLAGAIVPSITANFAGPKSIIAAAMAKNFEETQAIITASLKKNYSGPQSVIAAALARDYTGTQATIAAAMASGLGTHGRVTAALAGMDAVAKSVENSQRQIAKNVAVMDAVRLHTYAPPVIRVPAFDVKKFSVHIPVDPTPGIMRENLEVMREMLVANQTLLKRDEEREAAKVIADRVDRRKGTTIIWLTVALVVLAVITVVEVLPK